MSSMYDMAEVVYLHGARVLHMDSVLEVLIISCVLVETLDLPSGDTHTPPYRATATFGKEKWQARNENQLE